MEKSYLKGRGAQVKTANKFLEQQYVREFDEGLDEELIPEKISTQIFYESPQKVVNKVDSPDVGMDYSLNAYQGCEHGCVYCYARTTHEYWGFSAGLDFETKIVVKKNAPELLERHLLQKGWLAKPIVLSGNTDCYQPLEQKLKITRRLLEVFAKYRHPVGIITKNATVTRDIDILKDLAKDQLVKVILSITTLDDKLRARMEPRTSSVNKKLEAIEKLSQAGIPVGIMNAPLVPGLNHHEIPEVIKAAAECGASSAGYTVVRLNGAIEEIFKDWLQKNYPDKFNKVCHLIEELHDGKTSDSTFGRRMKGEGEISNIIKQLFDSATKKYMSGRSTPALNTYSFRKGGNYTLFN
ncbi:MAG: PA0069 family radical SAM protein [Bacteroidota bacterium]